MRRQPVRRRPFTTGELRALAWELLGRAKAGDRHEAAPLLVDLAIGAGKEEEAEALALALQGRSYEDIEGLGVVRGDLLAPHLHTANLSHALGWLERALFPRPAAPRGIRMPSAESLLRTFRNLTPQEARLMRRIGHAADDDELATLIDKHVPSTAAYVRSLHSNPYNTMMWRRTVVLHALDSILGTYGVEPLGPIAARHGPAYEYLNAGDADNATLIYTRDTDSIRIGAWGDIAARHRSW